MTCETRGYNPMMWPSRAPNIEDLLAAGRESTNLEYKQSGSWGQLGPALIRTVLGMANTEGGGRIVVGVAERNGAFSALGMSEDHLASFPTEDDFRAAVNGFADPFIQPQIDVCEHKDKRFLVISVFEFEHEPVICMKTRGKRLQEGALYVRSNRLPETTKLHTPTDMRALMRLARKKLLAELRAELDSSASQN